MITEWRPTPRWPPKSVTANSAATSSTASMFQRKPSQPVTIVSPWQFIMEIEPLMASQTVESSLVPFSLVHRTTFQHAAWEMRLFRLFINGTSWRFPDPSRTASSSSTSQRHWICRSSRSTSTNTISIKEQFNTQSKSLILSASSEVH